MSDHEPQELRPAYRTLNDPSRLLGLSLGGWTTVLVAGALGYGWLMLSPFGWRANLSVVVVGLGAPAALLLLRESSTVSPGRLLLAVLRWRLRSPALVAPSSERPVRRGAIRLDSPPLEIADQAPEPELPWVATHQSGVS
jgi:hypothetical protein